MHTNFIAFIVSFALFMEALDATIINTALPVMAHHFNVNPVDLKIALISYLISLAIFIPISGWIADKFGIKKVFLSALSLFTLASLWCGYSQTVPELVMARSIQGLGGALMSPVGRLILLRTFKRHQMVEIMNSVIMVVSIALMLGPLLGGFITDHFSWQWIFWLNVPVGICTILFALFFLPSFELIKVSRFDLGGFLLFSLGLAGLTFALSDISESQTNPQSVLMILGLSCLFLIIYFLRAYHKRTSFLKLSLFRVRTFRVSVLGNLICRISFGGSPFLLPLLFQVGLGYSAQQSGLLIAPMALGVLIAKFKSFSVRLLRFFGYRYFLIMNTFMLCLVLWSLVTIDKGISLTHIYLLSFLLGTVVALQYSGLNSLGYADITNDDLSGATSLVSTTQQLGQSFGVALAALLLRLFSSHSSNSFEFVPKTFHLAFIGMGFATLICILFFLQLKRNDGHQMLHPPAENKPYL